ncbi:uncharacterized protein LOC110842918 [Folsomia candida]|uniref:Uncharacterized protein n=1 Tax=Folsomia candida TaxID=158441 RepID=A0A226EPZ1_FOLCA|nr:uncharacterized protein LOC110842918 [Folsomia candida]OXA59692.1 hypothetical protein Fcan01_04570 [Folsomia candida]
MSSNKVTTPSPANETDKVSSSFSAKKAKYSWEMLPQEPPKTDDLPPQYKDRTIVVREVRKEWCSVGKIVNMDKRVKRMDKSDSGVEKIRNKFYALVRPEEKEEEFDSPEFDKCTPEGYTEKVVEPLSDDEKQEATRKIKAAKGGIKVDGTNFHLVWREIAGYERLVLDDKTNDQTGGRVVCTFEDCFKYLGTSGVAPFCSAHRSHWEYVVSDYEDKGSITPIFFHSITPFTYENEEKKAERASTALNKAISTGTDLTPWDCYAKEFTDAKLPPPTYTEIPGRRRYFTTEQEANKVYAARQYVTLLRKLVPATSTFRYLNKNVALPNGAETAVLEEMKNWGMQIGISKYLDRESRASLPYPFGKEREGKQVASSMVVAKEHGVLYVVSNPHINYFGKTLTGDKLHEIKNQNDTVAKYSLMEGNLPWELIPLSSCPVDELEANEAHLHLANSFADLLRIHQQFVSDPPYTSPEGSTPFDAYPICLNKFTNAKYFDDTSFTKINQFMLKRYGVEIYIGPTY